MKHIILSITPVILAFLLATPVQAEFETDVRQALQGAVAEAQAALEKSGAPGAKTISILPLAGDKSKYVQGLLKNAVTASGLTYVEGGADPLWNNILAEVEWDERKEDMLDPATLTKFGRLKATQTLLYGVVREAGQSGQGIFVELELHLTSIETKEHIWGGMFAERYYLPGQVEGIIALDPAVREVLKNAVEKGAASIRSSGKLSIIRSVAMIPLAGDIDGYVSSVVEAMLSDTKLYPKNLDAATLAEARQILRDQPQRAEAVMYGAVRDLSRKVRSVEPFKTVYEVYTEVQLRIESAATGDVLWSATLSESGLDVEERNIWQVLAAYRREALIGIAVLVGLIILSRLFAGMRRAR